MSSKISNLPRDLLEEILSRVPVKSSRAVRSTCRMWNILAKDGIFTKKLFGNNNSKETEFLVEKTVDWKVNVMSVNEKLSIKRRGKLISLNDDGDGIEVYNVFHCDGLLLCNTTNEDRKSSLVVWNPFSGQTLCIRLRDGNTLGDKYALGYEKNNHKVLRFCLVLWVVPVWKFLTVSEVYNFSSGLWKFVDSTHDSGLDMYTECVSCGVSLKGNTYWYARERTTKESKVMGGFMICFDFTREKFGPHLTLPFHPGPRDELTISSVRGEQLAVLLNREDTSRIEIWITTKIGPEEVSWSKLFLAFDMKPHIKLGLESFFINTKKHIAVFLGKDASNLTRSMAYIIGKEGYLKEVDLGETTESHLYPLVCSYVPSSVHIKQPVARVIRQHHSVFEVVLLLVYWVFLCLFIYMCGGSCYLCFTM